MVEFHLLKSSLSSPWLKVVKWEGNSFVFLLSLLIASLSLSLSLAVSVASSLARVSTPRGDETHFVGAFFCRGKASKRSVKHPDILLVGGPIPRLVVSF